MTQLIDEDAAGEPQRECRAPIRVGQARRPPGLVHQIGARTHPNRCFVRQPDVARCTHAVLATTRNSVAFAHRGVVLEAARSQQDATAGADPDQLTVTPDHRADDGAI